MIYEWIGVERISMKEVIKRLYDKEIPPRRGKTPFWTHGPLLRLLRCESYVKGEVYYYNTEAIIGKRSRTSSLYKPVKKTVESSDHEKIGSFLR